MSFYFRRLWYDSRLKFDRNLTSKISIGYLFDKIWRPDIYFLNEKSGTFHSITVPNILLQVKPDGHVILSTKYGPQLAAVKNFTMLDVSGYR